MQYCFLGRSEIKISRLGFGCMSLDLNLPGNENLLLKALDGGINYFDTADLYDQGANETLLGRSFAGKRNQVILASKVGNQWRSDGSGWDWNPSPAYIRSSFEQSVRRLQTDYLDYYQLHGGTLDDPMDEIIETFEDLKKNGRIREYGISSIRPAVIREYVKRSSIAGIMMQYSLLDRRPEEEVLPLLLKNNISVLVRGSLARGLLVSKPPVSYLNYSADEVSAVTQAVKKMTSVGRTAESLSLQFVYDQPAVSSVVVGIRTENQLDRALESASSEKLSVKEREAISNVIPPNTYESHR